MHRVEAPGATVDNLFTEGNPSTGVPATTVSAAILNALQEEVCNVIEAAGITLQTAETDTWTQLQSALTSLTNSHVLQNILGAGVQSDTGYSFLPVRDANLGTLIHLLFQWRPFTINVSQVTRQGAVVLEGTGTFPWAIQFPNFARHAIAVPSNVSDAVLETVARTSLSNSNIGLIATSFANNASPTSTQISGSLFAVGF